MLKSKHITQQGSTTMKLTFHGAAKTVTGSQHLLEVNGKRILLDCGLFQGKRKEAFELNRTGFCAGKDLDCLILSHAHIDHSGNIPCLVKKGFTGDIICTSATRDLCAVMLMDAAHIQEQDVEFANKLRKKNRQKEFEPLYTKEDAVVAMDQFVGISYNRKREILPGVHLTLVDAGHMMGSANVILDIHDREKNRDLRLVFSGDIGRSGIPIINDPAVLSEGADILIMESTYGNRQHPPYPESEKELERIVNETYQRGGTLLIPAFAVGRTQQLVYALHRLFLKRDIPRLPIYVDSPLATRVTDIFRLHPETYDSEIREFLLKDNHSNPFGFDTLRYTQSVEDSKELNFLREPAIIISASGMMEGGRILHHLRKRISDKKNTILVTGWQAPNTLGRRIVEGQETVRIFGEEFPLKAKVETLTGFSGHADRDGLLAWAGAMRKKPARTFVVHGEEDVATAFAESLRQELGFPMVEIPEPHQAFEV
jgi:metallo-beta-lactamase family protein